MNTWTWSWAIRNFVAELLVPPGIWILIALLAMCFLNWRKIWQKSVVISCLLLLWVTSTTVFANWLILITDPLMNWPRSNSVVVTLIANEQLRVKAESQVQAQTQVQPLAQEQPQAIVILGGGRRRGAIDLPEYSNTDVSKESMERLRMGAKLAKQTNLPVLLTGGAPDATSTSELSEAAVMGMVLQNELGIKAKWLEEQSNTSAENAKLTAELLKKQGIDRIYLVTHFWHMPRAQRAFERQGIKVAPIPHSYYDLVDKNSFTIKELTPADYFPSSSGITRVRQIWHELVGQIWYWIRG